MLQTKFDEVRVGEIFFKMSPECGMSPFKSVYYIETLNIYLDIYIYAYIYMHIYIYLSLSHYLSLLDVLTWKICFRQTRDTRGMHA